MKSGFVRLPSKEVVLNHGTESMAVHIVALPAGYAQWVRVQYPPPVAYRDGKPVPAPSEEYDELVIYVYLARAMGAQIDAVMPSGTADRAAWHAYACAVREEFRAANLVDGDIVQLSRAMFELSAGDQEKN